MLLVLEGSNDHIISPFLRHDAHALLLLKTIPSQEKITMKIEARPHIIIHLYLVFLEVHW
jgi:hypothetical protein